MGAALVHARMRREWCLDPGREEGSARAFRHTSAAVTADAPLAE